MDTNLPSLRKGLLDKFKSVPSGATLASYVGVMLLNQALSTASDINDPRTLHAALLKQTELVTPDRVYKILNRQIQFPMIIKTMKSGIATDSTP